MKRIVSRVDITEVILKITGRLRYVNFEESTFHKMSISWRLKEHGIAILSRRLAENPNVTVCLIEAGPSDEGKSKVNSRRILYSTTSFLFL